jgi:hypothetical protein
MSTAADLATALANIQADDVAIGNGIKAVQAAIAGLAAGTVTQAELDAAVAGLAQAHTDFGANVATLGTIAANP